MKRFSLPGISALRTTLLSPKGWVNDGTRILVSVCLLILLGGAYQSVRFLFDPNREIRIQNPFTLVTLETYRDTDHGISFRFPKRFVLDTDSEHRYGENYISGFHLASDRRTGCDIRLTDTGLNFSKTDAEITTALEQEIRTTAKEFQSESSKRLRIGDEPAFLFGFSFTDPLGSRARIDQVMLSHGGDHYLLLCGGNAGSYPASEKDFRSFFTSFRFER